MTRPVILLTGFEPFGGADGNPSWDAVSLVSATWSGRAELHVARLPTAFEESVQRLQALIDLLRPDVVVATGLAQGRASVTPEVIAINRIDARIPDNAGSQPRDAVVVDGGPDGLFSTLPVKAMVAAMRKAGVPAALSYSAGTFVCNSTFYALMSALKQQGRGAIGGFVHVPATPAQSVSGDCPTMSLEAIARGIEAGLMACLVGREAVGQELGTIA